MSKSIKKKIKVSKAKRKTWRKHTDISEIETYLDDKRHDERVGFVFLNFSFFNYLIFLRFSVQDKSNKELFVIEKSADKALLSDKTKNKNDTKTQNSAKKTKTTKDILKDLKCYHLLEPSTKVAAIKTSKIGPAPKKTWLENDRKFAKQWPAKKAQIDRYELRQRAEKEKKEDAYFGFKPYDIWGDESTKGTSKAKIETNKSKREGKEEIDSDLKELADVQLVLSGKKPPKLPKHHHKKPSLLPSIETPHPGQSYNPAYDDHQELLQKAIAVEQKRLEKEARLKRTYDDTLGQPPTQAELLREMSQGLGLFSEAADESKQDEVGNESETQEKSGNEDENENENENETPVAKKKKNERKTEAQRNKEKSAKERVVKAKARKEARKRALQINMIKKYKKELEADEKRSLEKQEKRKKRKADKMYQARILGSTKFEEPEEALMLTTELVGSLRQLRPEGSVLEDRFKSLQKRNIIESRLRKKAPKRRYKLKKVIKKHLKEDQ